MLKSTMIAAVLAISGFAVSSTALAATANGSFKVNLTITSVCTVSAAVGANDINFGNQAASASANLNQFQATPLSVACSVGTPYVINLTPASTTSTTGAGNMVNGSVNVPYQLRQATGQAGAVWGNTGVIVSGVVTAGNAVQGTGTGVTTPINHTVYATVPSTNFAPNTYTDTVNVSVVY